MSSASAAPAGPSPGRAGGLRLLAPLAGLLVVTAGLYIWARNITPNPNSSLFGQKGTGTFGLKAWMATGVLALACFQLYTALWLYERINKRRALPHRLGIVHRVSGVAAIVLSLPIAYNCLYAYGFEDLDNRVLVHALAGCFFYGAFAAKIIIVRSRRLPGWMLPTAGGTLIVIIVLLWYSAALWKFNNFNVPGLSPSKPVSSAPKYPASGGAANPNYDTGGAGAASGAVMDTIVNFKYGPDPIRIPVGGSVTWTNQDVAPHTATATSPTPFDTGTLTKGQSKTLKFSKAGTFAYICTIHPFMKATLIVK